MKLQPVHCVFWIREVMFIFTIFKIILLWPGAMSQFLEPNCGYPGISPKIMHGQNAENGTNPWMAYIFKYNDKEVAELVCGGTLIHKRKKK